MSLGDIQAVSAMATVLGLFGAAYRYNRDQREHQRERLEQTALLKDQNDMIAEIRDELTAKG